MKTKLNSKRLKIKYYKWLLVPLLQKRLSSSDNGVGSKKKGRYIVYLKSGNELNLIIENINDDGVVGKQWNGAKYDSSISVPFEQFKSTDVKIKHDDGEYLIICNSLSDYFFEYKTGIYYLKKSIRRLGKFIFNKRKLVMIEIHELLRVLIDIYIEKSGEGVGVVDLMTRLYSMEWVTHPEGDAREEKVRLYLKALVESKDVVKNGTKYCILPQAILTIEKYEEEERRHKKQINLQRVLVFLTFLLAFSALLQAIVIMIQAKIIKFPWILDLSDLFGIGE
jgi:hypothetical protein